jgi:hypothetical protein
MAMTERQALEILCARAGQVMTGSDEDAEALAIGVAMVESRKAAEADEALPYTHRVVGWRNRRPYETEHKSLDEAIEAASYAFEYNEMAIERIVGPDGETVLEGAALDNARKAYAE